MLARGELISYAQDCLRRVTWSVPDQLISRGRGETMLREELLWPPAGCTPLSRAIRHDGSRGSTPPCIPSSRDGLDMPVGLYS